ncbi:MAG: hybrid sensor histidine kinase/response regulator [Alteromonadaceae bacterium]|uniref:ATP-binding protein n=1 Tax=Paraglaciecola chathamensis TaxID=368405 RepID=UPI000C4E7145|nr:ATP-binding protein [Paraglaciecola agarilytica]MBN28177.1 hybrid sensor histidine kinase/response regulator [Alteromonadaceae bacterium]
MTLLTALLNGAVALSTAKIPAKRQSLIILILLLIASANSFLHLWFSEASEHTTNIFVTIIASGIVLSNRAHWTASILFNWVGWITISVWLELALIQHFFFAMAMSTLLSWFAHLARKKLVTKQIELEIERDLAIQHELEAKAATETKSAFLANMSHEIRTPMNGVIGMIELVSQTELNTDQKNYLATAKRSADSLLIIINDILDFSKIEVGELTIEFVEFDLEQFFEELIHDQHFHARKKGLTLALSKGDFHHKHVVGDPYRITQIMNNLLSNAIKFTESGGITVHYDLVTLGDNLQLKVEIKDTGIGVSETALPFLFDSFSQADTSTTRKFGGTGLGLSITKQLCELMNGDISVKSQLNQGSTFSFSVRLKPPRQTHKMASKTPVPVSFEGLQVLLVEDNEINQEVMLAILKGLDVNVFIANDGLEALATLSHSQRLKFDLILMDCQMPNLDGYEATRRIRAGEAGEIFSHIPIAALTANVMDSERVKCIEAGMNEYLTKPVEIEALKSVLVKYHKQAPAQH